MSSQLDLLNPSLMILDGSEVDRATYIQYLASEHQTYPIFEADTLATGIELWRSQHPALVLVNSHLPDGDGLTFLRTIAEFRNTETSSAIFLIPQGDEQIAAQAMQLGAVTFLVKEHLTPLSLSTCLRQVQERMLLNHQLLRSQELEVIIAKISLRIRQYQHLDEILNAIVQKIQNFLAADRVLVFQFQPDMSGSIVAEAVRSPYRSCLGSYFSDTCFQQNLVGAYLEGKIFAVDDIYTVNLTDCHVQLLEDYQVKSNLVVPILQPNNEAQPLWGLLIVHQCSHNRHWQSTDIGLLQQLSVQLVIAIQQAEIYQSLQMLNASLEQKVEERTRELNFNTQILEQIHDGVFTTDVDGTIQTWNRGAENLYGYSADEIIGQNVNILLQGLTNTSANGVLIPLVKERHAVEVPVRHKSGKLIYISLRLSTDQNAQGQPPRLIACTNDVSDRVQAEQRLIQLNQALEARVEARTQELQEAKEAAEYANRAKSEFLALMSHEIRTPMNGILGLAYLGLQGNPNPRQKDYLTKIQSSAQSLLEIINDILDFSKIEAGKLELESAPFQLDEILNTIANVLGLKAAEKDIELIFSVREDVPQHLVGDSLRLGQVLMNLTSNAVKFTDSGSVLVTVETITRTDASVHLKFTVEDTGIGIASSQIDTLFESFTQSDPSISRKYSGTGLGLAICKRLVNLMGGSITVKSELNQGSIFEFDLDFPYGSEPDRHSNSSIPNLAGLKALVVDDNVLARDILTQALENFDFQVTTATSGFEALDRLRQAPESDPFDLLLIDWCMPGLDGIETTRRIKTDLKLTRIPQILMVTAYQREDIWQQAEAVGINAILPKPISRSHLFETILTVLDRPMSAPRSTAMEWGLADPLTALSSIHILVVEDNTVNQQVAQELLQSWGITVDIAVDGHEAIAKIQAHPYDAILMDVRMPGMDGLEATRQIRKLAKVGNIKDERFATVPIIAMTAHAMNTDRTKSLAAGMNDHLPKPVQPQELLNTLTRWISPSRIVPQVSTPIDPSITELAWQLSPSLDVGTAVARVGGNWIAYQRLLQRFQQTHSESATEIRTVLDQGDLTQAFYLAHTLKGAAGNIGADRLYQSLANLEQDLQANTSHPELLISAVNILQQDLRQVLEAIIFILDNAEPSEAPVSPTVSTAFNPERVTALLTEITELLDLDLVAALDQLQILKQQIVATALQANVELIEAYLADFDTDGARRILHQIRTDLSNS